MDRQKSDYLKVISKYVHYVHLGGDNLKLLMIVFFKEIQDFQSVDCHISEMVRDEDKKH